MGTPGPLEIILIFLVVLLIFGAKRIPEIARGIGKGIREFKDATSDISRELNMEDQRQQINRPQPPQQGTPAPRGGTTQAQEQAPPEPARADNPGNESDEANPQEKQAS